MAIHNMFENEDSLLAALQKGDNKAYKEVYRLAYGKVEHFILANSGQEDDARNIFQESIIALMRMIKKPDFKLTSKVSTLMYSISRNLWLKYLNRVKPKEGLNIIDDENSNFVLIAEEEESHHVDKEEQYELITKELENLGEPCKTVIMAAHFQKLPREEIAKLLGYTKAFVRIKLFRCMAKLRKAVIPKIG